MHVFSTILGHALVWLAMQSPVAAPVPATADSLASGASPDSTASLPELMPSPLDSLVAAPGDSLAAFADSVAADSTAVAEAARVVPPPWTRNARWDARTFDELEPALLAGALEDHPATAMRVAGDWGAPSYLSVGPISGPAPEILYDGVPSRSPADLDPAVFDRSVTGLLSLSVAGFDAPAGGPTRLMAETLPPLPGRTHLRTHFAKDPHETYLRGLWLTTPGAPRVLRFGFEEWKTEDGYNFTTNPAFDPLPEDFGRSKMRRFLLGGDALTDLGRASVSFSRGRRLYRGTVLGTGDTERWTGQVSAGLDRAEENAYWRVRGYHLDFSDDDRTHTETRDAVRLGLSVSRTPVTSGPGFRVEVERWTARFVSSATESHPEPSLVARTALSWRLAVTDATIATAFAEGVYAGHASDDPDGAGGVALEMELSPSARLRVGGERRLRVPTLLETDGLLTMDIADGSRLRREGAGALPLERQDRAHATFEFRGEHWFVSSTAESWRLTRGIGWQPAGPTSAITVSDLELAVHQVSAAASLRGNGAKWGWSLGATGHHLLGPLAHAHDRGAGWPQWLGQARARVSRQVASPLNRGYVEVAVQVVGPRFDDTLAAVNGARLPSYTRLNLRAGLKIRDAELYAAWHNLLDQEIVQVAGTLRRGREIRLGMNWPFFN